MAKAALDDQNEDKPLDPAAERVRRKMVRFMAINLGILFVAVMAVVLALVYRSVSSDEASAPAPGKLIEGRIALPVGAEIVSQSASGDRISITTRFADGHRVIFVYGINENRMIGRFDVVSE